MLLGSFSNYYGSNVLTKELFSIILVLSVSTTLYFLLKQDKDIIFARIHIGIASLIALALIWVFVINLSISLDLAANMTISNVVLAKIISLIIYTIIGVLLFYYGDKNSNLSIQKIGKILLAFVIIRLLIVEIWSMPRVARIVTFVSMILGVAIAVILLFVPQSEGGDSFVYLVICGVAAISSMIIPGVSGSFVLLVMGNYQLIL